MTDIVKRLREMSISQVRDIGVGAEGAQEIERLRAELAALRGQKPAAWACKCDFDNADGRLTVCVDRLDDILDSETIPLYAAPVPAVKEEPLTKHEWYEALGAALHEIWPDWSIERATSEMFDYAETDNGGPHPEWTVASAKEVSRQYVSEFGEQI